MSVPVIICDDHHAFRKGLETLVNATAEFQVVATFANCNQIVKALRQYQPELVLLDINMPGIDGLTGLELIRNEFPTLKVIMLTVFDDDASVYKAIRMGADGYILKSTAPEKILEALRDVSAGGVVMTPAIARQVLRLFNDPATKPAQAYDLSSREKEVLSLLVNGESSKQIGERLFISTETVRSHIKRIYQKMQVSSRAEAVRKALGNGI